MSTQKVEKFKKPSNEVEKFLVRYALYMKPNETEIFKEEIKLKQCPQCRNVGYDRVNCSRCDGIGKIRYLFISERILKIVNRIVQQPGIDVEDIKSISEYI